MRLKDNWQILLSFVIVLIILVLSLLFWFDAVHWANIVASSDEWYKLPELSRMEVRDAYDLAFKKIILSAGILFVSAFLIIKVVPNKK
jgi:hypothetical protein